jgi:hypothetical protein
LREIRAEQRGGPLAHKVRRAFCYRVGEKLLFQG